MCSIRTLVFLVALLFVGFTARAGDRDLLFRWPAHEGAGSKVADTSGNANDGQSAAGWRSDGEIKVLSFDGQKQGAVRVKLAADRSIGKGDFTFMAWIRCDVLGHPGPQDQRRIFSYGQYPDASINIDITGRGSLTWYLTYQPAGGKMVAAGGSTPARIQPGQWVHVALTQDRSTGKLIGYLNGRESGESDLPAAWVGDFTGHDEVAAGASWHEFQGAMADIALWRRALGAPEVRAEFAARRAAYAVTETDNLIIEDALRDLADQGGAALEEDKPANARALFQKMLATPKVPPAWAAWTQLRIAQAYRLENNSPKARDAYKRLADNSAYPAHLRQEAAEILQEMDRSAKGLPARDVLASRTTLPPLAPFAAEVWLAPDGNDRNPGTQDQPVASLPRARDLARALRKNTAGPLAVIFKSGMYPVREAFALTAEDSGQDGAPVVWKAAAPGQAIVYGGLHLGGFATVADPEVLSRLVPEARDKVLVCDLKKFGLTDLGKLAVRGFGQAPAPPTVEVFADGAPLTLARWPNDGFVNAGKLLQPGSQPKGIPSVLEYLDERPARWTKADDAWLFGYFKYLWADATIKIGGIDPATKRITTDQAYAYGEGDGMDARQGIKYYAFNLLEELDSPGEWYLDRKTGQLYLWPTGDLQKQSIEIGGATQPFITLTNVANVRIEGLVCDLGRADGIRISKGRNVQLVGDTIRRVAGTGVVIDGGTGHTVLGCDVHHTGRGAIVATGGDRPTLTRADFLMENCHLHHFGRIDRTYTPAIQAGGVGMRLAHNLMHDGPSSAVRVDANDVMIEYNEVHSVVGESDDQGAMETYGNPTFRGLAFRYNRFENIGNGSTMTAGQSAIRFDDVISGLLVYSNIFVRSANGHFGAIQINSGRDNIFDNNLFLDCKTGISGGYRAAHALWAVAGAGSRPDFIRNALYLQRYPEMQHMLDKNGQNFAWRQAFIDSGSPIAEREGFDILALGQWKSAAPIVALDDPAARVALKHFVLGLGFRPIPAEEIGLYPAPSRASWPVSSTPATVPAWRGRAR